MLTPSASSTDRIERSILIQAPRERVWNALSNAETFGAWFGADLKGKRFEVGQRTQGQITIPNYEHLRFDVIVERIEPQTLLSYRWHPCPGEEEIDDKVEPRTRVTFTLSELSGEQTRLSVVETGFDAVHPQRRLDAFRKNTEGWAVQLENIKRHAES